MPITREVIAVLAGAVVATAGCKGGQSGAPGGGQGNGAGLGQGGGPTGQ